MDINYKTETQVVEVPNVGALLRRVSMADGEVLGVEYLPVVFSQDSDPPEEERN